jgi:4-hydroxybenzoate polyprenyltransferase
MKILGGLFQLVRPLDWSKNSFVLAGLLFSHRWDEAQIFIRTLWVFGAFCMIASCVYVLNDIVDRHRDAHHPTKCHRPIASGLIQIHWALLFGALLCALSLIAALEVSVEAFYFVVGYGLMNVAYTFWLKHVAVLDVFVIATGFVLRILIGTVGIGIPASGWVILCGLSLALFLGFCKRKAELLKLGDAAAKHRAVLGDYSSEGLNQMIAICAACVMMSYSLYTLDDKTIEIHGTRWMIMTTPFVLYGIFRYLHQMYTGSGGGRPARTLSHDPHLVVTVLAWLGTTWFIIG